MKKNRKISNYRLKKIILHFCVDIEASKVAILTGINRNTINAYYTEFRNLIAKYQVENLSQFESHMAGTSDILFGKSEAGNLVNSKLKSQIRKYPVYGIIEHNGMIFLEQILMNNNNNENINNAKDKFDITLDSIEFKRIYSGMLVGMFPKLVFLNNEKKGERKKRESLFNIESFWSFSTRRLNKFNGVSRNFYYHLTECSWRWKKTTKELINELNHLIKKT